MIIVVETNRKQHSLHCKINTQLILKRILLFLAVIAFKLTIIYIHFYSVLLCEKTNYSPFPKKAGCIADLVRGDHQGEVLVVSVPHHHPHVHLVVPVLSVVPGEKIKKLIRKVSFVTKVLSPASTD